MKIIALGHYKRVGKDSFADFLISECAKLDSAFRVKKKSWAWKLKQVCHELYGWAGLREPEFYETKEGEVLREIVLPAIGKSPRQIWIDFGTAAVREKVYDRTWLDYLLNSEHDCDVLIIPDTRFHNEVQAVQARGGHCIKVVRPGYGPGPNKPDRELLGWDGWDNIIGSTGDMDELKWWANEYAKALIEKRPYDVANQSERFHCNKVETIEPWQEAA